MGLKNRVRRWRRRWQRRRLDAAIARVEREVEIARRRAKKGKKLLAELHKQRLRLKEN